MIPMIFKHSIISPSQQAKFYKKTQSN